MKDLFWENKGMSGVSKKSLRSEQVSFYKENGYLLANRPLFLDAKFQELCQIFEELLAERGNSLGNELDVPHFEEERLFEFLMADEVLGIGHL